MKFLVIFIFQISLLIDNAHTQEFKTLQEFHFRLANLQYQNRYFPSNLEKAKFNYEQSFENGLEREKYYWRFARVLRQLGKITFDKRKRTNIFEEGKKAGEYSILIRPNHSASHLWYASNIGSYMVEEGLQKTLSLKNLVKDEFQKAFDLDHKNDLAILGLAYWYYKIPSLFGGNDDYAFELLEQAKFLDPNQTSHYFVKGQFLEDQSKYSLAIQEYEKILQIQSTKDFSEKFLDTFEAKKILKRLRSETTE